MRNFFLLYIFLTASLFGQINLLSPKNNAIFTTQDSISFTIESYFHFDSLKIEISNDQFGSILDSYLFTSQLKIKNPIGAYQWRVKCFLNGNSIIAGHSTFSVVDLNQNMFVWLKADQFNLSLNTFIQNWNDSSLQNNDVLQNNLAEQAYLDSVNFKSYKTLTFDGGDSYFFSSLNNLGNQYCIISVLKKANTSIFVSGASTANGYLGYLNNHSAGGVFRAIPFTVDTDWQIKTLNRDQTNINHYRNDESPVNYTSFPAANEFSVDRIGGYGGFKLNGSLSELLLFDSNLSSGRIDTIHQYLRTKYAPPIELGDTHYILPGCSVELSLPPYYTNIDWGEVGTGNSHDYNTTGVFYLSAEDPFGMISYDTIAILNYNFNKPDTVLCLNDSIQWAFNLNPSLFNWNWNDLSSNDTLKIYSDGFYWLEVTDSKGCVSRDSIQVLSYLISLGPNHGLCSGDNLSLTQGANETVSYEWRELGNPTILSTTDNLVINTAGDYWVEGQSANGCIARDTISLTINGTAPTIQWNYDFQCLFDNTAFTDTSIPITGSITAQDWDFGDGANASGANVTHTYATPGDYQVRLSIATDEGCSTFLDKTVTIHPVPDVDFTYTTACSNLETSFSDNSTITSGSNVNYQWIFPPANIQGGTDTVFTFDQFGTQNVRLNVTSDQGCMSSRQIAVDVLASPNFDFTYIAGCEGELVLFMPNVNTTNSGAVNLTWDFNGTQNNTQGNTNHIFNGYGDFPVTLNAVRADGNCAVDSVKTISISATPLASFSIDGSVCAGIPLNINDLSNGFGSSINTYIWTPEGGNPVNGANPQIIFDTPGFYDLTLQVQNEDFCPDDTTIRLTVIQSPNLISSVNPPIGQVPFLATFNAQSDENVVWTDALGNVLSNNASFNYTFNDESIDTFYVSSSNAFNCNEVDTIVMRFGLPYMDVSVDQVQFFEQDGLYYITAQITNNSNFDIRSLALTQSLQGGVSSMETWNGVLAPGQVLNYIFNARLAADQRFKKLVCVNATILNSPYDEADLSNNQLCKTTDASEILLDLYPNPNSGSFKMNVFAPSSDTYTLELYDWAGNKVHISEYNLNSGNHLLEIALPNFEHGIYYLKWSGNGQSASRKLMIWE